LFFGEARAFGEGFVDELRREHGVRLPTASAVVR